MELSIGFSPCPNDTFIFDALIHGKIDTGKYTFKPHIADVEQLNLWAFEDRLDISKISYRAWAALRTKYNLLRSGGALGRGCGPILIAKDPMDKEMLPTKHIAIPGQWTTANFLLDYFCPNINQKTILLFSEIENAVVNCDVDAGVIIHENRFTYESKGLVKIQDLGQYWEENTGAPIPLGAIGAHRRISREDREKIDSLIRQSILYALSNPEESMSYVRINAQELDEGIIRKHIQLYVNEFSIDIGQQGELAIENLLKYCNL